MVTRVGSIHEWYRFLDAHSDDEAVSELFRHVSRLDEAQDLVVRAYGRLAYAPGGEVDELLLLARTSLSDASRALQHVAERFRAGEHRIA